MRFVPVALAITLAIGLPLPVQAVNTIELRGRLTDVTGTPLPGLQVVFRNPATGVEFRARTDGDGRYRLVNLPVRQYLVLVHRADGRLLFSGEGPELEWRGSWEEPQRWDRSLNPDLDCTVTRPATLEGVVEDPAAGVLPGVTVRLRNEVRPCTQPFAITDVDGKFKFTGLADGDYLLTAQLQMFAFSVESIHLESGQETRRNITGQPNYRGYEGVFGEGRPGRAVGVVFDDECRPLAGVRISLRTTESDAPVSITTAADGSFALPEVLPGVAVVYAQRSGANPQYRLRFEHPEFQSGALDLNHPSADFRQNWNVRLRPRQRPHSEGADVPATVVVSTAPRANAPGRPGAQTEELIGNVVDDRGCPVLGAVVAVRDHGTGREWSVKTNGMGFRFAGLPAAYYDLTVVRKGYLPVLVDAEPLGFSKSLWSVTLVDK